ncbi:hypothetical protein GW17_00001186 [Ensete ventricosum]|nr:hypothetical protein GW17_00001186 [Ensete ventricosum]
MLLLLSSELVISFFPWVLRAHAFDVSPTDSVLWFFDHSVSRCSHIPTHRSLPPFTLQLDIQPRKHKTSKKFGSVGDANVFYWFQNRRSRSRRRQRQLQAAGLAADPGAALHARQVGTITVFINGIPSEVPRGPVDLRAMFGQNVMLVHSSGELLPINEYGILLQSLQMGESYFLRYYNEGHDGISRTVILDGAAEKCNLSTHRRDSSLSSTDGYARHGRTRLFYSTPTGSSEASWNSQPGLLSHPPGSVAVAVSALPLKEPAKPPSFPARRLFGATAVLWEEVRRR